MDTPFDGDAPSRSGGSARALIAAAQRLADTPRPPAGYPLSWYVESLHVGDMTAIAAAALRAD